MAELGADGLEQLRQQTPLSMVDRGPTEPVGLVVELGSMLKNLLSPLLGLGNVPGLAHCFFTTSKNNL